MPDAHEGSRIVKELSDDATFGRNATQSFEVARGRRYSGMNNDPV